MPAFDVARRWKGRVVLDRTGGKLGTVLDVYYDAENDEPGRVLLGAPGMEPGGRLWPQEEADLDEEEDAAAEASVRGLPPR